MKMQFIVMVGLFAAATVAHAGTNAVPLGFELGAASRSVVQASLRGRTNVVEKGTNGVSGGVVLEASGQGLDVEDLKQATFIFDRLDRLVAVVLKFPKGFGNDTTTRVADMLRTNYKEVQRSIPRVGDASARFTHGASVIQLDAPHMSFEFTVAYMTTEFEQAYHRTRAAEKSDKEQATRSRL